MKRFLPFLRLLLSNIALIPIAISLEVMLLQHANMFVALLLFSLLLILLILLKSLFITAFNLITSRLKRLPKSIKIMARESFIDLGLLCLVAIMIGGVFLFGRDALVLAVGTSIQAKVIGFTTCSNDDQVPQMPIIQYHDSQGKTQTVQSYDFWSCPHGYTYGESIAIIYNPANPTRIVLEQDRLPLSVVFLIFIPLAVIIMLGGIVALLDRIYVLFNKGDRVATLSGRD